MDTVKHSCVPRISGYPINCRKSVQGFEVMTVFDDTDRLPHTGASFYGVIRFDSKMPALSEVCLDPSPDESLVRSWLPHTGAKIVQKLIFVLRFRRLSAEERYTWIPVQMKVLLGNDPIIYNCILVRYIEIDMICLWIPAPFSRRMICLDPSSDGSLVRSWLPHTGAKIVQKLIWFVLGFRRLSAEERYTWIPVQMKVLLGNDPIICNCILVRYIEIGLICLRIPAPFSQEWYAWIPVQMKVLLGKDPIICNCILVRHIEIGLIWLRIPAPFSRRRIYLGLSPDDDSASLWFSFKKKTYRTPVQDFIDIQIWLWNAVFKLENGVLGSHSRWRLYQAIILLSVRHTDANIS